jgi:hypothetical protein
MCAYTYTCADDEDNDDVRVDNYAHDGLRACVVTAVMIAWYVYMHVVCCYVVALLLVLMMCVHIRMMLTMMMKMLCPYYVYVGDHMRAHL